MGHRDGRLVGPLGASASRAVWPSVFEMEKKKTTCVYTASGEANAQQVRAFLEANEIPCSFHGESLRKTHGFTLNGLGLVEIHVPEAYMEQARELLTAAESGELTLDENETIG